MNLILEIPEREPSSSGKRADGGPLKAGVTPAPGKPRVRTKPVKLALPGPCLLPGDNEEAYRRLGDMLTKKWRPETEDECRLVSALHDTQWRLARIPVTEMDLQMKGLIEYSEVYAEYEEPMRSTLARAAAYEAHAKLFDKIGREETRLYKMNDRLEAELRLVRARRPSI